ncbi:MAG: hypothetical protein ACRCYV_03585 [Aeromonas sp.]
MSQAQGGWLHGKWPAVVASYDGASRTCEITLPAHADNARLLAEIAYPIGDKSRHATMSEIEILPGDLVWVEFIQGDPRFPLITGWRNPTQGNDTGWRRWHQANIELNADALLQLNAGGAASITASDSITLTVGASTITITGGEISLSAGTINLN